MSTKHRYETGEKLFEWPIVQSIRVMVFLRKKLRNYAHFASYAHLLKVGYRVEDSGPM